MTIEDIVKNFETTPFLFIGSGLSRRYLDLPNWEGLLSHFANKIHNDEFSYRSYVNNRSTSNKTTGEILPQVASDIQSDYDSLWFYKPSFRSANPEVLNQVRNGVSPFKAEVADFIRNNGTLNCEFAQEINLLIEISDKSLSGIITTNYDSFLEDTIPSYKTYVGQNELIFSAIQGIAEIYKIHGSIDAPNSLVLTAEDYAAFNERSAYLAAKLMTIFMEYPIIFMGYSLSDTNIQKIIQDIATCLTNEQLEKLRDRFIFIDYVPDMQGYEISDTIFPLQTQQILQMKRIKLSDYSLLYSALQGKKSKVPARILRRFKEDLYEFTITNEPTSELRVAYIDDDRITDDDLVLAIGKKSAFSIKGLKGISADEWYRNLMLGDLPYSADELLDNAFPKLYKSVGSRIPYFKFLKHSTKLRPDLEKLRTSQTFDQLIPNSYIKRRHILYAYNSPFQIWNSEKHNIDKATRLLAYLDEEKMNLVELESILFEIFDTYPAIFIEEYPDIVKNAKTNIRRLIRIYDYLKWGK